MIQMQTSLDVADNSGARRIVAIKILGQQKTYAGVGDVGDALNVLGEHRKPQGDRPDGASCQLDEVCLEVEQPVMSINEKRKAISWKEAILGFIFLMFIMSQT